MLIQCVLDVDILLIGINNMGNIWEDTVIIHKSKEDMDKCINERIKPLSNQDMLFQANSEKGKQSILNMVKNKD